MKPTGVLVPIVTPFRDGVVDHESTDRLVDHLISEGVTGLVVLGTTGESLALDPDEARQLVDRVVARVAGRVAVYIGVSGAATHKVVRAIAEYDTVEADGYLVSCPYYNRPPQDGLLAHFAAAADATERDIIIYNIPSRTAVNMSNDVLLELATRANVTGVKDCCGSLQQSFDLLHRRQDGFSVLTGEDHLLLTLVSQGGDGGILASAHVGTRHFVEVVEALDKGELDRARNAWYRIADVIDLLFAEPNPMPVKYWLSREGVIASPECRLPLTSVSSGLRERLDQRLARGFGE
jgi:4-hydroxy-tetrahydrodipicolinate synthase